MAFIDVIEPEEAEGDQAAFYEKVGATRGNVANVHKVASLHPRLAKAHLELYMSLMYDRDAGLDRRRRELVAVAVSWGNECPYCVQHHVEALERYEEEEALLDALVKDPTSAPLDEEDEALVTYALSLTRSPGDMGEGDVEALRRAGFDDEDVLAVAAVASYFNFVNRLVLGLGAELESKEERDYEY